MNESVPPASVVTVVPPVWTTRSPAVSLSVTVRSANVLR